MSFCSRLWNMFILLWSPPVKHMQRSTGWSLTLICLHTLSLLPVPVLGTSAASHSRLLLASGVARYSNCVLVIKTSPEVLKEQDWWLRFQRPDLLFVQQWLSMWGQSTLYDKCYVLDICKGLNGCRRSHIFKEIWLVMSEKGEKAMWSLLEPEDSWGTVCNSCTGVCKRKDRHLHSRWQWGNGVMG